MAGLDLPTLVQRVRIDADTKGAEGQVQSSMQRIGGTMTKVGVGLSAAVTVPIVGMAVSSVKAASDLAESASKVGVVFEGNAEQVKNFASTAATQLGISEQAALEAAGTFGNLFRALGVGTGPAADMSTSLVTLASDLASFNNANPEDVLLALRSGLLGEAEPLRQFGVSLSAARIESEALASGLVKPVANATKLTEASLKVRDANDKAAVALKEHGKGSLEYQKAALAATKAEEGYAAAAKGSVPDLNAAQKAQAAYAIIQQDTALAQGDFSRTSSGLANQQRILAAQFTDVKASLGQALLPTVSKAAGFFIRLLAAFKGLSPEGKKIVLVVSGIAAAAGPLLIVAGKMFKAFSSIKTVMSAGSGLLGLGPLLPVVIAVAAAGFLIYKNWDKVRPILQKVSGAFTVLKNAFSAGDTFGLTGKDGLEGKAAVVGSALRHLADTIIPVIKGVIGAARQIVGVLFKGDFKGGILSEDSPIIAGAFKVRDVVVGFVKGVSTQVGNLIGFFQKIAPQVKEALGHVARVIGVIVGVYKEIIQAALGGLAALWRAWGDDLLAIVKAIFRTVGEIVNGALEVVTGIIRTVLAVINGDWGKAWDGIKAILAGAWDAIFGILRGAVNIVRGLVGGIVSTFGEVLRPLGNFLFTWIVAPFESVLTFIGGLPKRVSTLASGMFDGIKDSFKSAVNWIIRKWNDFGISLEATMPFPPHKTIGFRLDTPDLPPLKALGGRTVPGQPFIAGDRFGPELVTGFKGSAQVLNADRTERLLRQIAGGAGVPSGGGDTYPISVQTVDRPSGEQLGRDIAWGISSTRGRPLVGSGRP